MIHPGFLETDYLERMVDYTVQMDDNSRSAFQMNGSYYGRYRLTNVFIPLGVKTWTGDSNELSYYGPAMFYWFYRNAELMRQTLIDETIPLHDRDGRFSLNGRNTVFGIFDGCRRSNVIALLQLEYWPALPELREAMLHEHDSYMRSLCVEAIGLMGKRGLVYAKDIRETLWKFGDDPYFLGYAVGALARLDDKGATSLICEVYEMARERIDRLTFDEAMEKEMWYIYLIEDITSALIKLDPELALGILAKELANPNPHVCHFTHNAFKLSPLRHDAKLIISSLANTVASLPNDPRWIFRRHRGELVANSS